VENSIAANEKEYFSIEGKDSQKKDKEPKPAQSRECVSIVVGESNKII
jgi:hypothetical protein